jgi:hypothetical protein
MAKLETVTVTGTYRRQPVSATFTRIATGWQLEITINGVNKDRISIDKKHSVRPSWSVALDYFAPHFEQLPVRKRPQERVLRLVTEE